MTDNEFLTAFQAASLPRKEWTHEAHVRLGWLYLLQHPFPKALKQVRMGIQKLNAEFRRLRSIRCMPSRDDSSGPAGYHDTITVAFMTLIASRFQPNEDFPSFRNRNADLFDRTRPVLLRHYSAEKLSSETARQTFLEPDLQPLPTIPSHQTPGRHRSRGQNPGR